MKDWFERMGTKIRLWLQGRYGTDELNRAITWTAVFLLLISVLSGQGIFYSAGFVLILWSIFRSFSKNIYKRREERQWWLNKTAAVKSWLSLQKRKWHDRKEYKYFRCKNCKTVMRVPRGKGRVKMNCRKCHSEMEGKT